METTLCSFCKHPNPPAAKFCNACGSSLKLQLCPHCGTIDDIGALTCYKCGQPYLADDEPAIPAETGSPTPRAAAGDDRKQAPTVRRSGLWAAAVALLLVVVVGTVLFQRMWRAGDDDLPEREAPPAAATAQSVVAERAAPPEAPQVPPQEEVGASPSTACSPAVAALGLCDHQAK